MNLFDFTEEEILERKKKLTPKERKRAPNKRPYPRNALTMTQRACLPLSKGNKLKYLDKLSGGDEELKQVYRRAVVDVLQNPLMSLSKQIGEVDVRIAKFERENPDIPLDKNILKAIDLKLKAAKIYIDANKALNRNPKARRIMENIENDESIIEADFEELVKS